MPVTAAVSPISVEEYLHSVYKPDMDLVDGILEDRNVGEFSHSVLQRALLLALVKGEKEHHYYVAQELRIQVSPTRFRVPDTCLLPADRLPKRIVTEAPLLCIEVLSPEDTFTRIKRRCQDYLTMGVPEVWILDPESKTAYVLNRQGTMTEYREGSLRLTGTRIELALAEVFGEESKALS